MMGARPFIRTMRQAPSVAMPTGMVVPDLAVKRSLVLDTWNSQRRHARGEAIQRDRLLQQRAYAGADISRLTSDWTAMSTSADSETLTSLRILRARSRQLVRDNPYAKHAVRLIRNNVIGDGMGMQAQVKSAGGKLQKKINDAIETAWAEWAKKGTCHTGGKLSFAEIEQLAMVQLVTSGEAIIRKVRKPFGGGKIPLALEVIESDRLLDTWQTARAPNGNAIRLGVEVDEWGRPTAYWFSPQHPGDYQFATFEPSRFMRVPAEDIVHLYLVERWPQTRGEPWFHAAVRSMHDVGGYEEAIVVKARASANVVGFIKSPEPMVGDVKQDHKELLNTEPGTWQRLLPGEEVAGYTPTTFDAAVEPFLRYMLRKMAIAVGVSYESLSRDYSQSNYSSSRMALLDDRDLYRTLQGFICRNLRADIHREFLDGAMLVGAVKTGPDYYSNPEKYQAVRFKPRGWGWIDPAKEVAAFKMAVRSGFMTQADVVAQTANGSDIEDVLDARREELDMAADRELVFDTDPLQVNDKGQSQPLPPAEEGDAPSADAGSADARTDDKPGADGDPMEQSDE